MSLWIILKSQQLQNPIAITVFNFFPNTPIGIFEGRIYDFVFNFKVLAMLQKSLEHLDQINQNPFLPDSFKPPASSIPENAESCRNIVHDLAFILTSIPKLVFDDSVSAISDVLRAIDIIERAIKFKPINGFSHVNL
jgi:hypothetical protein